MADTELLHRLVQSDPAFMASSGLPTDPLAAQNELREYLGHPTRIEPVEPPMPDTSPIPAVEAPEIGDPVPPPSRANRGGRVSDPQSNPDPLGSILRGAESFLYPEGNNPLRADSPVPPGAAGAGPENLGVPTATDQVDAPGIGFGDVPPMQGLDGFSGEGSYVPEGMTPAFIGQAGLGSAAQTGEAPPVDTMAPEMFDPETGERPDEVRKLGLLERIFGEKGSDSYQKAGKALMMAGAAIMSSQGNLGQAIGEGIQAGLMTYDDAMDALRREEIEARKLGMAEEAHAMNMELQRLRLQRTAAGANSGSVAPQEEDDPIARGLVLASVLEGQFGFDSGEALRAGAQQAFGLPAASARPPSEDPMAFLTSLAN